MGGGVEMALRRCPDVGLVPTEGRGALGGPGAQKVRGNPSKLLGLEGGLGCLAPVSERKPHVESGDVEVRLDFQRGRNLRLAL